MSSLQIEISPGSSYAGEGEFGQISCNGMENFPNGGLKDGVETRTQASTLAYPILRMEALGQGSSSIVYKSVMLHTLQVTAEKVFIVHDEQKRIQLFRELESLKSLCNEDDDKNQACPFLVNLLEVFSNPGDGTLSMCLDYMDCGSLQQLVNRGGCADQTALASIVYQMTSGLKFLHDRRLIHRDVKPSNALVSSTGCIKLADFGLARTLDSGQSLATSFVGTFLYMAPERLTGESYSFQSDIWSLGLTLHAVAMGAFPYVGKTGYWEVLHATQQGPPSLPSYFSTPLRTFLSLTYQGVQSRASAETLLKQPFVSARLGLIPEQVRSAVCVQGSPTLPSHTVAVEDEVITRANRALAARITPAEEAPKTARVTKPAAAATSTKTSASASKAAPTARKGPPSSTSTSNTRTPVPSSSTAARRVESFGTSKTAAVSQNSKQTTRRTTGAAPATQTVIASKAAVPSRVVLPVPKKAPVNFVRSVSAMGINNSKSQIVAVTAQTQANKPQVPVLNTSARDSPELTEQPFGPVERTKLVNSWIDYANEARAAREARPVRSDAVATQHAQDSFNYAMSPSAAVNSLRRLVSRQHDSSAIQVTEETVKALAAALHCDEALLVAEFRTAMKLVNQEFRSQAHKVRSSTAPVLSSLRLSTEEPVRTLGEARRSMRLAAGLLASQIDARTDDFSMSRMSTELTRSAEISTLSAPPTHRPGSPFLSSPLASSELVLTSTPLRAEPSLSPVPAGADSEEEEEILDDAPRAMSRARSDADLLEESICEEFDSPLDDAAESPRVPASHRAAPVPQSQRALTPGVLVSESDAEEDFDYADESFEDFQE